MQIKKIESKGEKERKQKRNQLTIGLILIFVMILSTAGYAFDSGKQEKKIYQGITFIKGEDGSWASQKLSISTKFLPYEVKETNGSVLISSQMIDREKFYFSALSSDELVAANEVVKNLFIQKTQQVCVDNEENKPGCENLPIKSCYDQNFTSLIFVFRLNDTSINMEKKENCIFFNGNNENLIKAADKFIFNINNIF